MGVKIYLAQGSKEFQNRIGTGYTEKGNVYYGALFAVGNRHGIHTPGFWACARWVLH